MNTVYCINKIFLDHIGEVTSRAYRMGSVTDSVGWVVNPSFVEWIIEQSFVYNPPNLGTLNLPFDVTASGIKYVADHTNTFHSHQSSFLSAYGKLFLQNERELIYDYIVRRITGHAIDDTVEYFDKRVAELSVEYPLFRTWYDRELYYRQPVQNKISVVPPRLERQTNTIVLPFPVRCYNNGITFDMVWSVFEDDMKNRDKWIDEVKDVIETYAIDNTYIAEASWYVDFAGWRAEHVKRRIENWFILTCGVSELPRRSDRIRKRKRE